jgi:hypothetical protein
MSAEKMSSADLAVDGSGTMRRDSGRGAEKEKSQTPINMLGDVTRDAPPGEPSGLGSEHVVDRTEAAGLDDPAEAGKRVEYKPSSTQLRREQRKRANARKKDGASLRGVVWTFLAGGRMEGMEAGH